VTNVYNYNIKDGSGKKLRIITSAVWTLNVLNSGQAEVLIQRSEEEKAEEEHTRRSSK
jgi:hypothetical protein